MPDNPTIKRPLDSSRINLNQPYEVNYWCNKFHCTEATLIAAVSAVGTSASTVESYLKSH